VATRQHMGGELKPAGALKLHVVRNPRPFVSQLSDREVMDYAAPRPWHSAELNEWKERNLHNFMRQWRKLLMARKLELPHFYGALWLTHLSERHSPVDYGLVSVGVITTAGVNYLVADMAAGANDINLFKFHGIGTGTNAEAAADTALQTEITTQYQTDNTRPTGSQGTGGSSNVYRTIGTITVDAAVANTEHGILTQAATGGGTLWDRSQYSVINLANGDSLQATYDATFPAGG
jgi:hypothetical protein